MVLYKIVQVQVQNSCTVYVMCTSFYFKS